MLEERAEREDPQPLMGFAWEEEEWLSRQGLKEGLE
jgi:hypothetical protein